MALFCFLFRKVLTLLTFFRSSNFATRSAPPAVIIGILLLLYPNEQLPLWSKAFFAEEALVSSVFTTCFFRKRKKFIEQNLYSWRIWKKVLLVSETFYRGLQKEILNKEVEIRKVFFFKYFSIFAIALHSHYLAYNVPIYSKGSLDVQ